MIENSILTDHHEMHWELHQSTYNTNTNAPFPSIRENRDLQSGTQKYDLSHDLNAHGTDYSTYNAKEGKQENLMIDSDYLRVGSRLIQKQETTHLEYFVDQYAEGYTKKAFEEVAHHVVSS